jgi:hypothetical protein
VGVKAGGTTKRPFVLQTDEGRILLIFFIEYGVQELALAHSSASLDSIKKSKGEKNVRYQLNS